MRMNWPANHFFLVSSNSRWAVCSIWKVLTHDRNMVHCKEKPTGFLFNYFIFVASEEQFIFSNQPDNMDPSLAASDKLTLSENEWMELD